MCPTNQEPLSLWSHSKSRSSLRKRFHPGISNALTYPRALLILKTSAPHKTTTTTDHLWSPPSITPQQQIIPDLRLQLYNLIFLFVHNVKLPSAWVVIDEGRFLCIQSQQSSVIYHGGYNKSILTDHAVMRITSVPFAHIHTDQIKYK